MKIIHVPKRPAIPKRKPFKQSRADSLMEELDKELDRRGYSGSPTPKQVAPLPSGPERPYKRTKRTKKELQRRSDVV